jgi:hypothetical protein
MKTTTAITLLVAALVLLLTSYLHDSAHRYDVVVAAAGSGGSQENAGSTESVGYLVDHKTGRVWLLQSAGQLPMKVMNCSVYTNIKETERGCEAEGAGKPPKNP